MIVGLTGGIASGKTCCSDFFLQADIPVADADLIAREIVKKGSPVLQKLVTDLGVEILDADGELNRKRLRRMIFTSPVVKARVNAIMHPEIHQCISDRLKVLSRFNPIVVYSAPLLFENNLQDQCDMVLVVDVSEELQIFRGSLRDGATQEDIKQIMVSQVSRQDRLRCANYVIDNSKTIEETKRQCQLFCQQLGNFL